MKMRLRMSIALSFLFLSGCVVAPDRTPPSLEVMAPDHWNALNEASELDELEKLQTGLGQFNSPALEAFVEKVLLQNPELKIAETRLSQAVIQARITHAPLKPLVDLGASAARGRQNFIGLPIPGTNGVLSTTSTAYGLELRTQWEVDLWGRIRADARAALASLQAQEADWQAARLSLIGQASKAWFRWVEAEQQLTLATKQVETLKNRVESIQQRYVRGLRPSIDLRLAQSNLANTRAMLAGRKAERDQALRVLKRLLGEYPAINQRETTELPQLTQAIPGYLPADIIARRPDLIAAERRWVQANQQLLSAKRSLYPRLSLTASGGTTSNALEDLLDGDFRVWNLVLGLAQPLFQGGRLRAGVDAASLGVDASTLEFLGTALNAWLEIETALNLETQLANQAAALDESVYSIRKAEELALQRYQRGVGDYLSLLQAQTSALTAESERLALERLRLSNRMDLILALGGDYIAPPATERLQQTSDRVELEQDTQ